MLINLSGLYTENLAVLGNYVVCHVCKNDCTHKSLLCVQHPFSFTLVYNVQNVLYMQFAFVLDSKIMIQLVLDAYFFTVVPVIKRERSLPSQRHH